MRQPRARSRGTARIANPRPAPGPIVPPVADRREHDFGVPQLRRQVPVVTQQLAVFPGMGQCRFPKDFQELLLAARGRDGSPQSRRPPPPLCRLPVRRAPGSRRRGRRSRAGHTGRPRHRCRSPPRSACRRRRAAPPFARSRRARAPAPARRRCAPRPGEAAARVRAGRRGTVSRRPHRSTRARPAARPANQDASPAGSPVSATPISPLCGSMNIGVGKGSSVSGEPASSCAATCCRPASPTSQASTQRRGSDHESAMPRMSSARARPVSTIPRTSPVSSSPSGQS